MKHTLGLVCAAVLIEVSCQNTPEPFAPPVQRPPLEDFRPYRISTIVDMSNEEAQTHFVQDFTSIAAPNWRWTGLRPTVRVRVSSAENLRYTIDFAIAEATFQVTGPVTVSFLVNDQMLDRALYNHAGNQHFEKAVPAGWVTAGQDATVAAEVDKAGATAADGTKLGMILVRIGLTQ
jgi:hypothetical protein